MSTFKLAVLAAFVLTALIGASADAASPRTSGDDAIRQCSQIVGHMAFPGDAGERNKDRMFNACLTNNGSIPGSDIHPHGEEIQ